MKEQQGLGQIFALSVVTAAAAEPMGTDCSARAAVLSGLAGALALTAADTSAAVLPDPEHTRRTPAQRPTTAPGQALPSPPEPSGC